MVVEKGYKQTEIGVIPEDWEVKLLSKIVYFFNGKAHENIISENGDFAVINSKFISTNGEVVKYASSNYCSLNKNDITIVMSDIPNGKALAKCYLVPQTNKYTLNQRIGGLRSLDDCPQYLFYQLNRNKYFISFDSGSGQTNLRKQEVLACPLPIPPLTEQTAIANALSDMDELIAQTEKLIEKKKAIKQGVMQELLKPKEGWVTKKLGESALILRGGSPRPIEDFLTTASDGINWIKIGDVGKNAKYITSTEEKITPAGMSRSRVVKPGDFLLSNSMSFGRPYIMQIDGCIHDGWLVITEYESNFDRDFLYYVLGSEAVFTQYKSMASGSSVLNLNKEIVKEVNVICPINLDEQRYIAGVLSDIDIDLDFTETKLQKLKHQKQGMMQALLTGKIRLI